MHIAQCRRNLQRLSPWQFLLNCNTRSSYLIASVFTTYFITYYLYLFPLLYIISISFYDYTVLNWENIEFIFFLGRPEVCFKPICFHLTLRPRGEETMMTLNEFFDPDVDLNFLEWKALGYILIYNGNSWVQFCLQSCSDDRETGVRFFNHEYDHGQN